MFLLAGGKRSERVLTSTHERCANPVPLVGPATPVLARYYDPATAQFLTVDPAVALTLSPYGYVAGDPLNRADPTGPLSPADLSSGQMLTLINECNAFGALAGPCVAGALCADAMSCGQTTGQLASSSASVQQQASQLGCGSKRTQLLHEAKELTVFAVLAAVSGEYYSNGGLADSRWRCRPGRGSQ